MVDTVATLIQILIGVSNLDRSTSGKPTQKEPHAASPKVCI